MNNVYDPQAYWSNRETPTRETGILPDERAFLEPLLEDAMTVLDYGPGIGRMFPLYAGRHVTGVDITDHYYLQAKQAAEKHGCTYDIVPVRPYDLGVASKVLLHVLPENIADVLLFLALYCKRVAIIDICTDLRLANHNFSHDFNTLLEPYTVTHWQQKGDQLYVVYY